VIRVTVELISAIDPSRDRLLGVMEITNDGRGSKTVGDYDVKTRGPAGRVAALGRVLRHRRQADPIWNLVRKACVAAGYVRD
jgi:hypothetical protein